MCLISKPDNITDQQWSEYWQEFKRCSKINYNHEQEFLKDLGYKSLFVPNHPFAEYREGKFKASNGIIYYTANDMHKGYGTVPLYEKDEICYGLYEILEKEHYKVLIEYPDLPE